MTPFYDIEKTQTGLSSRMKDAVDFLKCLHVVLSVGDHKELGPHRTDSVGDCREYACPGDQRCKTKVSHILAKTFHRSDSLPVLCLEIPAEHLVPYPLRVLSGESCYAFTKLAVQLWREDHGHVGATQIEDGMAAGYLRHVYQHQLLPVVYHDILSMQIVMNESVPVRDGLDDADQLVLLAFREVLFRSHTVAVNVEGLGRVELRRLRLCSMQSDGKVGELGGTLLKLSWMFIDIGTQRYSVGKLEDYAIALVGSDSVEGDAGRNTTDKCRLSVLVLNLDLLECRVVIVDLHDLLIVQAIDTSMLPLPDHLAAIKGDVSIFLLFAHVSVSIIFSIYPHIILCVPHTYNIKSSLLNS